MADLKKLDETVGELEASSKEIKEVVRGYSQILGKIEGLKSDIEKTSAFMGKSQETLEKTQEILSLLSDNIRKGIKENQHNFSLISDEIKEELKETRESLHKSHTELSENTRKDLKKILTAMILLVVALIGMGIALYFTGNLL
ncbi:MAG: hypothetical protein OXF45_05710 [Candidatus Dadabacteria bacterium]|nr:hypothetical protein [Candidatus Dadabacteria bacterium]